MVVSGGSWDLHGCRVFPQKETLDRRRCSFHRGTPGVGRNRRYVLDLTHPAEDCNSTDRGQNRALVRAPDEGLRNEN